MDGPTAYRNLRAEKEAYFWDKDEDYISTKRKRWAWINTVWEEEPSFAEEETDSIDETIDNGKPNV